MCLYAKGYGVEQDKFEALKWPRLAAAQGNEYVQSILGAMYAKGQGVEQNPVEAKKWFRKACDNGYTRGCEGYKKLNEAGY